MPFHKTLNILYFNAFAAQSLNDVLSNFDIWMYCEKDAFSQNTQYSIFFAFAAQSLNDVLSNFDIWMYCEKDAFSQNTQNCNILMSDKKGAAATDRLVLCKL